MKVSKMMDLPGHKKVMGSMKKSMMEDEKGEDDIVPDKSEDANPNKKRKMALIIALMKAKNEKRKASKEA